MSKVKKFKDELLNKLFDISAQNVEEKVKIKDLEFLGTQKNGHGSFGSVDRTLDHKKKRIECEK